MLIKCLPVGNLEANCYIVADEAALRCAVIDPGDESNVILDYLESQSLKTSAIFLTHGHFDHFFAAKTVAEETGAPIWIHKNDCSEPGKRARLQYTPDENTKYYRDGDVIQIAGLYFAVLETPGHSPGSVTLLCGDALFTGDTLFRGTCGRTDLSGGDQDTLLRSLARLGLLKGNFDVYPGHMEATTLDRERGSNPWLRQAMGLG